MKGEEFGYLDYVNPLSWCVQPLAEGTRPPSDPPAVLAVIATCCHSVCRSLECLGFASATQGQSMASHQARAGPSPAICDCDAIVGGTVFWS